MAKVEVYWVKMFGGQVDGVIGLIDGKQVVLVHNDAIQSSSAIYGDLAIAEPLVDCFSQAIAMYKEGPQSISAIQP